MHIFDPSAQTPADSSESSALMDALVGASSWDVATRYHEFKSRPISEEQKKSLRRLSVEAILVRAKEVLGSLVHPKDPRLAPMTGLPGGAEQVDFDLEETLEHAPEGITQAAFQESDIWMSYSLPRRHPLVLCVDTSLSMTGEKLALTAVALCVVLLEFPRDEIGIIAFENEARVLKQPDEVVTLGQLLGRFLDVPAQGYTHLEDGIASAMRLAQGMRHGKPASTVLVTDGKYTAGKDPAYLAPRFAHLIVLKMGTDKASLRLCQELARGGHGSVQEVSELEALPSVMYSVVKDLLRGRSVA